MPQEASSPYTAADIRFTVKGGKLYALILGWPDDGKFRITTLARDSKHFPMNVEKVEMLSPSMPLKFERTSEALIINAPPSKPNPIAYCLRITPSQPLKST